MIPIKRLAISLYAVMLECPCAISFLAMAQSASLRDQTESRPCTKKGLGVIIAVLWRQLITVLASTMPSIDANMQGWPQEENDLATGGIRLATGEFKVGHRTDRSLTGIESDLSTLRNGLAPVRVAARKGSHHLGPHGSSLPTMRMEETSKPCGRFAESPQSQMP